MSNGARRRFQPPQTNATYRESFGLAGLTDILIVDSHNLRPKSDLRARAGSESNDLPGAQADNAR